MNAVAITGLGLVSCQGEGRAAHATLGGVAPDETAFAPFPVFPLAALPMDAAIPRREWRQMEGYQRMGTYAAGLAIADAGAAALVPQMDLMVAAGGGERDTALDTAILAGAGAVPPEGQERHVLAQLQQGLRPTLFLAQLPNLMAGSISIVHGVGGSSRTLMGEEAAGAEALRVAHRRVAEGRSQAMLVGGAYLATRWDTIMTFAARLHRGAFVPTAARTGMVLGSQAAFLVLEPLRAALARGATPLALLSEIATDAGAPEGRAARLGALPGAGAAFSALPHGAGEGCVGDALGHGLEAAFPMAVALAALAVAAGQARVGVRGFGHEFGEFGAVLEAVP